VHVAAWPSFALNLSYSMSLDANRALAQAYALRTQSFVINSAPAISQEVVDLICQTERDRQLFRTGGGYAQVFAPDGKPLIDAPAEDVATLTYAEIDLNMITFAKMVCDSAGHAARPDLFQLTVNKSNPQTVSFVGRDEEVAIER
jgi:aliphatic nitrilase